MEEQYRMIEQDIESLLDESNDVIISDPVEKSNFITPTFNMSYTNSELAAKEGLLLGQYVKWSTVESDELNVPNQLADQQNNINSPPLTPTYMNNYLTSFMTAEMIKNVLLWCAQFPRQIPKKGCSFCKKNGQLP